MKTGIVLALLALLLVWVWTSGKGGQVIQALFGKGPQAAVTAASATPASTSGSTATTTTVTAPNVAAATTNQLQTTDPLLGYAMGFGNTIANNIFSSGITIPNYVGVPNNTTGSAMGVPSNTVSP
jgi:hypothetical protein